MKNWQLLLIGLGLLALTLIWDYVAPVISMLME